MRSVADDLREADLREQQKMTPGERVALALRLGERDLRLYMAANNVDRETAREALRRAGAAGRRRSVANE